VDVNDDGQIDPLDALVLINEINAYESRTLMVPPVPPDVAYLFLDVNGDDKLTPLDVLVVINDVNANSSRPLPEGEGASVRRPADRLAEGEADSWYPGWLLFADTEMSVDPFFNAFRPICVPLLGPGSACCTAF
jgi:hypothetical protein